jgi:hypothetical protein
MDYKVCQQRNSGEAYRRFRSTATGLFAGAHEVMLGLLRHKLVGAVIAVMGSAGVFGTLITFWPR